MKTTASFVLASAAIAISGPAAALTINIDGNLSDWGVTSLSWVPSSGVHYTVEDQTGGANAYLNPGYGGQAYDAEALYAAIIGNRLYIALATGHNPRTLQDPARNSYGAGDFAIDSPRMAATNSGSTSYIMVQMAMPTRCRYEVASTRIRLGTTESGGQMVRLPVPPTL
ncbi:MAG: hypothetical protein Q8N33_11820 [Rhodocyclaceae bacterium]|nr:hypothetical protein [Rhodocyclaceae bacterium]